MARHGRRKLSSKKGVFNPEDADRVKHTRLGVWDLYEEKIPEVDSLAPVPIPVPKWERYLEIKRDLPYIWRMFKDVASIRSCWSLLGLYSILELVSALLPAVTLWYVCISPKLYAAWNNLTSGSTGS